MGLTAGGSHELDCFSDFTVQVQLTKKGLENYEHVAETIFKYAQRLKEAGPQQYVYDESSQIGQIRFDYADKGDGCNYCVSLARSLPHFDSAEELE